MSALYFRITEKPDPGLFDAGWTEIVEPRFALDRSVWRAPGVSRSSDSCAELRYDTGDRTWQLKNMAAGRVVVLHDGCQRYDLRRGMSMTLWPGAWRGTLTEAFTFQVTSERPDGVPIRRGPRPGPAGGPLESPTVDGLARTVVEDDDETRPRTPVMRARHYLGVHWRKRLALAYLWRQHLEHTPDSPEDLDSAAVARDFRTKAPTITGWREDLARHVFGERGHQHAIRDFIVDHEVLTRADVHEARRYLRWLDDGGPDRAA